MTANQTAAFNPSESEEVRRLSLTVDADITTCAFAYNLTNEQKVEMINNYRRDINKVRRARKPKTEGEQAPAAAKASKR